MSTMKKYQSYKEWKADQSTRNQNLIGALEQVVDKVAPEFEKSVKWGQGCWVYQNTPRVYMHTEDDYVQMGFYAGSSLDDPLRLLEGKGKYVRYIRVNQFSDIDEAAFSHLLQQVRD